MKFSNWKDIAELVGISAIVASLVFVGMQLEQSQRLAFADSVLAMGANGIEERSLQAEHIDIWLKGNAGDELNANDYGIYKILFTNRQSGEFYIWISLESTGTHYEGVASQGLATFLYRNPGARAEWDLRRGQAEALRVRADGVFPEFAAEVEADLTSLDNRLNGD
jgi:hypothetical protein